MSYTTIEELRQLRGEQFEELASEREVFENAKAIYDAACGVKAEEFLIKLNDYYDGKLLDKIGISVRVGNILNKEGKVYRVVNRYNQIIIGEIMNNPRVVAIKINEVNVPIARKNIEISPFELRDYEVVLVEWPSMVGAVKRD